MEVRKARRLEVEYLNNMKVAVPHSLIKHKTGKEPIKVRWVDSENQRDTQEQAGGEGVPPRVQELMAS